MANQYWDPARSNGLPADGLSWETSWTLFTDADNINYSIGEELRIRNLASWTWSQPSLTHIPAFVSLVGCNNSGIEDGTIQYFDPNDKITTNVYAFYLVAGKANIYFRNLGFTRAYYGITGAASSNRIYFDNCDFSYNGQVGLYAGGGNIRSIYMTYCYGVGNGAGVFAGTTTTPITMSRCYFEGGTSYAVGNSTSTLIDNSVLIAHPSANYALVCSAADSVWLSNSVISGGLIANINIGAIGAVNIANSCIFMNSPLLINTSSGKFTLVDCDLYNIGDYSTYSYNNRVMIRPTILAESPFVNFPTDLTFTESYIHRRVRSKLGGTPSAFFIYKTNGIPGPDIVYPRIIQSNPSYGSTDGTTITLNGVGLSGCTSLLFGSTSGTITSSADTFISGVVPSLSAGRYDITVSGANGIAGISGGWTSVATERKITSLSQTTGDQNTYITIDIESEEGLFSNASGVYFGETPVISFKVISPYLIKAVVPTITPDLYRVEVV